MTEPWGDAHAALAFGAVALDNLHNGGHPNMIEHVATLRSTIEGLTAERGKSFPEVVTLCGSTRFKEAFESENRRLTLAGHIVISVGLFGHAEGLDMGTDEAPSRTKRMLDDLHLYKIDLADRVHVINVGGYIGTSTRREIDYAESTGKAVTYLEEATDE